MDGAEITILINPKTDQKDIPLMLKKIADRIDRDWSPLLEEARGELAHAHGVEGIAESLIRIRGFQMNDFEKLVQVAKEKLNKKKAQPDEDWPFE
jgi:hypothetical protein